jgi:hypothetical protein
MEVTTDKVSAMASARYANTTSKESIEWINIAQSVTTPENVHACVKRRRLQADLDHHTIAMTVSFLRELMARQNAQYTTRSKSFFLSPP